jgi:cyanate lyase
LPGKAILCARPVAAIMSAINFSMDIERVEDPEGERVRITYEGTYLPYKW